MPEQPTGAAGDSLILDGEIVPGGDDMVVPPAPTSDTSIVPEGDAPATGGGQ